MHLRTCLEVLRENQRTGENKVDYDQITSNKLYAYNLALSIILCLEFYIAPGGLTDSSKIYSYT